MTMKVETMEDVAAVRRWLSDNVREGNGLARRLLRALDRAAPGTEVWTARLIVSTIFNIDARSDDMLAQMYARAGCPYGDTEEGRRRWAAEQADAERARRSQLN